MTQKSFSIVALGEVLWDVFESGRRSHRTLGGAPANFAFHAHHLGGSVRLISRVGDDPLGKEIKSFFRKNRISVESIQTDKTDPTGTVQVDGSDPKNPAYEIRSGVAWDGLRLTAQDLKLMGNADAICFGSLAQRRPQTRAVIHKLLRAARGPALKVFDINLRQNFYSPRLISSSLELATVLKLNTDELKLIAMMFRLKRPEKMQVKKLADRFDLRLVALTRGAKGSLLYSAGEWSECGFKKIKLGDTVGAGDAFTAALVLGMLNKMPLDKINACANELARYVCSKTGAMHPAPKRVRLQYGSSR